jgi:hypothetical protein
MSQPPSFLFTILSFVSPPFACLHLKTHSAQKLLLDSLTVYFTEQLAMGGSVIHYEPATIALLELYLEAYQIFLQVGWLSYF